MSAYVCIGVIPKGANYEPIDYDTVQVLFSWSRNSDVYEYLVYACSEDKYRPLYEVQHEWVDSLQLAIDMQKKELAANKKVLTYPLTDIDQIQGLLVACEECEQTIWQLETAMYVIERIQVEDNVVVWLDI